jgi:hypothetical protein
VLNDDNFKNLLPRYVTLRKPKSTKAKYIPHADTSNLTKAKHSMDQIKDNLGTLIQPNFVHEGDLNTLTINSIT